MTRLVKTVSIESASNWNLCIFLCVFGLLGQDALLKAAMVAGFQPNICVLYRGQRSPCAIQNFRKDNDMQLEFSATC